jgi:hypothetical protein
MSSLQLARIPGKNNHPTKKVLLTPNTKTSTRDEIRNNEAIPQEIGDVEI